jgi:hypothetical protein
MLLWSNGVHTVRVCVCVCYVVCQLKGDSEVHMTKAHEQKRDRTSRRGGEGQEKDHRLQAEQI